MHVKTTVLLALAAIIGQVASGKDPVASLDFDDIKPAYLFSYGFAGYGDFNGDELSLNEQMHVTHSVKPAAGIDSQYAVKKLELETLRDNFGNNHPSVKVHQLELKAIAERKSAGLQATLDSSKLKIPNDSSYDYAGWGVGACYDLRGNALPTNDLSKYVVEVDAKVSGTRSLGQSKLNVHFVVPDGKGPVADDNDNDDVVLELVRGEDGGANTFVLGSEYQTLRFDLDDFSVKSGKPSDLAKYDLTGIVFVVQAQGDGVDIGTDKDNVLYVDNIRLIRK